MSPPNPMLSPALEIVRVAIQSDPLGYGLEWHDRIQQAIEGALAISTDAAHLAATAIMQSLWGCDPHAARVQTTAATPPPIRTPADLEDPVATLYYLQTHDLDNAEEVLERQLERYLTAGRELQRELLSLDVSDTDHHRLMLAAQHIRSGVEYYGAAVQGKWTTPPSPALRDWALDELRSYPTTQSAVRGIVEWAGEQGLYVRCDTVEHDGITWYRVLSIPVLSTQTTRSGVVYAEGDVIDHTYRDPPSLPAILERYGNLQSLLTPTEDPYV